MYKIRSVYRIACAFKKPTEYLWVIPYKCGTGMKPTISESNEKQIKCTYMQSVKMESLAPNFNCFKSYENLNLGPV